MSYLDKNQYEVKTIPLSLARELVTKFHYAKGGSNTATFRHGLFRRADVDPNHKNWSKGQYIKALDHPLAVLGFHSDFKAMKWADTFVMVLPCGRSAHLELGWACGEGKTTMIILDGGEDDLMYKMADFIVEDLDHARTILNFMGGK